MRNGDQAVRALRAKTWQAIRNEEIEKILADGELTVSDGGTRFNANFSGKGVYCYFGLSELPMNCGALYLSGQDGTNSKSVPTADFIARNAASLMGYNTIMMSGAYSTIREFTKLRTGWRMAVVNESNRKFGSHKKMGYAVCNIKPQHMAKKGY
jgi:hypothetical protein